MKTRKVIRRKWIALLLAALMLLSIPCAALAASANDAVNADATGVLQVVLVYTDDDGNEQPVQSGTGFLINNNTIITCDHVVTLESAYLAELLEIFGKTEKQFKDKLSIKVTVLRDLQVRATVKNESAVLDFAILTLSDEIYDRTYLTLRESSTVQKTESVWALGFPSGSYSDAQTYTSEGVTITDGQVSQLTTVDTVDYVQNNAKLLNGSSGGPLVDEDGYVIGVCKGSTSVNIVQDDYYYAVAIDQVMQALDSLGIEYMKYPDHTTVITPEPSESPEPLVLVDKSELNAAITNAQRYESVDYTEETASDFTAALGNAQAVAADPDATQDQVNQAISALTTAQSSLELKQGGISMTTIIIIAAAIVVIAVIAVIIILMGGKKKGKKPAAPQAYPPVTPQQYPQRMDPPGTSVLHSGATETTVLNVGSNETTVLGGNFGSLTRTKSGEQIKINNADFVIGKDRTKVSYCIEDNSSVSRTHARVTSRGGVAYAVDMKSTNGTFVNGVKLNPGQEVALRDGDKITVADEEFMYRAQ